MAFGRTVQASGGAGLALGWKGRDEASGGRDKALKGGVNAGMVAILWDWESTFII
jgi:hypothetical protein